MSDKIEDGGPAFPRQSAQRCGDQVFLTSNGGMSLRDWFAGQALAGLTAEYDSSDAPRQAYRYADEMLATRKGGAK